MTRLGIENPWMITAFPLRRTLDINLFLLNCSTYVPKSNRSYNVPEQAKATNRTHPIQAECDEEITPSFSAVVQIWNIDQFSLFFHVLVL